MCFVAVILNTFNTQTIYTQFSLTGLLFRSSLLQVRTGFPKQDIMAIVAEFYRPGALADAYSAVKHRRKQSRQQHQF